MQTETIQTKILASQLPTPCYILDKGKLIRNCKLLKSIQDKTGCKILLAQKAFSNYDLYSDIAPYLAGTEASGLYEARLGAEEMPGKECHVFCSAYREQDFAELLKYADHIVFNSPTQLKHFGSRAKAAGKEIGIRINPQLSTQQGHEIYDPCAPGSRLGTTIDQWKEHMTPELEALLDGIHFHTLCEQNADALAKTLTAVEKDFGFILHQVKWLNMGGGHHITRQDYDVDCLIDCITHMQQTYDLQIYLEPGEAVALNAGYLYTSVLDIVHNGASKIAILDMSAACHTPDVIEMPYRPPLFASGEATEKAHSYRLAGPTCLAGDIIGDYSFDQPLCIGHGLVFEDMAIYSTCKNNTFNGMPLPPILATTDGEEFQLLAEFGYDDFKYRLGSRR
ncbi:MAG: carboxynorspermidine decarboxylase [Lachnospiraceae bacterium]|nr:carboxynorspermidine decarboxylase [Lachnospiraceae bacterium]MBQ7776048.1 carboxynorspermidine decarboxylase [Lachnospiraceae bacterium]